MKYCRSTLYTIYTIYIYIITDNNINYESTSARDRMSDTVNSDSAHIF